MLDFYKSRNTTDIRKYRYTYNLYFSNIAIFSPLRAMDIYCNLIDVFLSREEGGRSEEQLYRWLNEQDINLNYINSFI